VKQIAGFVLLNSNPDLYQPKSKIFVIKMGRPVKF
jgi:hypothetical protein